MSNGLKKYDLSFPSGNSWEHKKVLLCDDVKKVLEQDLILTQISIDTFSDDDNKESRRVKSYILGLMKRLEGEQKESKEEAKQ